MIFRPKSKIQTFFPPKIRWSPKKKKGLRQNTGRFFFQFRKFKRMRGGSFRMGGLFSIFHRKSASKAQKTCDFAYFTSQWWGLEPPPPPPPLATLLIIPQQFGLTMIKSLWFDAAKRLQWVISDALRRFIQKLASVLHLNAVLKLGIRWCAWSKAFLILFFVEPKGMELTLI